jgi:hypothetical protein
LGSVRKQEHRLDLLEHADDELLLNGQGWNRGPQGKKVWWLKKTGIRNNTLGASCNERKSSLACPIACPMAGSSTASEPSARAGLSIATASRFDQSLLPIYA